MGIKNNIKKPATNSNNYIFKILDIQKLKYIK